MAKDKTETELDLDAPVEMQMLMIKMEEGAPMPTKDMAMTLVLVQKLVCKILDMCVKRDCDIHLVIEKEKEEANLVITFNDEHEYGNVISRKVEEKEPLH